MQLHLLSTLVINVLTSAFVEISTVISLDDQLYRAGHFQHILFCSICEGVFCAYNSYRGGKLKRSVKLGPQCIYNREKDEIQLLHTAEYILRGLESDVAIQRSEVKMEGIFFSLLGVFSFMDYACYK